MSGLLSEEEIAELMPSELLSSRTPVPTQVVASDEFERIFRSGWTLVLSIIPANGGFKSVFHFASILQVRLPHEAFA